MARGKANSGLNSGEIPTPDFERAAKILKRDVRTAEEKVGEHAQTMSTAFKAIGKECNVNTAAAKQVFKLSKMSDEKRDDFLRSFSGMLTAFNIGITQDLVDQAEGQPASAPIIPIVDRAPPQLATVQ